MGEEEKREEKSKRKVVGRGVVVALGVICVVLAIGLAGAIANYTSIINDLNAILASKNEQIDQLQTWLQGNITYYENQLSILQSEYASYKATHNHSNSEYNALVSQAEYLQDQIALKEERISSLESQVNSLTEERSMLQTRLENLTQKYESYIAAYESLVEKVNWRFGLFNVEDFITLEDPHVRNLVFVTTGGWSDQSDVNELYTDIKRMYDWVVNNIEYRSDGLYPLLSYDPNEPPFFWCEMWQLPNETLLLGEGDCEDMAILLCTMIEVYWNEQYMVEVILIQGENGVHVAVQIPVTGNEVVILDPAGQYYTSDSLNHLTSKSIDEEIENWLNYWKPSLGDDVYVYRVFSDYIDQSFNSTEEYLDWMKNRQV